MGCTTSMETFDEIKDRILDENRLLSHRFEMLKFQKAKLNHDKINKSQEIEILNQIIAYDIDRAIYIALELKFPNMDRPILIKLFRCRVHKYIVGYAGNAWFKINYGSHNGTVRLRTRKEQLNKTYMEVPLQLELDIFSWNDDSQWNNGYSSVILYNEFSTKI